MEQANPFSDFSSYPHLQRQIAATNQSAFRQLHTYYYRRLYHFAFSMVKTREAAEEIIEDVFIRIWQQRSQIIEIRNLRVYLYTAVKNGSLNFLATKAKENLTESFDHLDIECQAGSDPEQLLITTEMFNRIQQAVDALPPRCKMIFKLIREDGLKYKEVAEILHISVNTIDAQMAIAVSRIAAALKSDFGLGVRNRTVAR